MLRLLRVGCVSNVLLKNCLGISAHTITLDKRHVQSRPLDCPREFKWSCRNARAEFDVVNGGQFVRMTISVLVWLGLLVSLSAASSPIGDANGDGKVDRADAETILQKIVGSAWLGTAEAALADVNA